MSGRRRKGLSPSLFPFLAVLVCTLGTLILLLALVAQNATDAAEQQKEADRVAQEQVDPQPAAPAAPRLKSAAVASMIDEERFRVEQLVAFRDRQTADIEQRRDQLTHLEDHMQRLRQRLQQLSQEVDRARGETPEKTIDETVVTELRQQIAKAKAELEQRRAKQQTQTPRVVIIPHKGPNGTDRRPVYLECTASGVKIWPEGSEITMLQLQDSARNANPLDAALRVIRHHAMQNYGDTIPPYPLIVVRPDGIESYAAVRLAMVDWDDQFGYELVPADVELAYQQPDKSLKDRVDLAIREAIIHQHARHAIARRSTSHHGRNLPTLSAAELDRNGRASGYQSRRDSRGSPYTGSYGSSTSYMSPSAEYPRSGSGSEAARRLDDRLRAAATELNQAGSSSGSSMSGGQANEDESSNLGALAADPDASPGSQPGSGGVGSIRDNPLSSRDGEIQRGADNSIGSGLAESSGGAPSDFAPSSGAPSEQAASDRRGDSSGEGRDQSPGGQDSNVDARGGKTQPGRASMSQAASAAATGGPPGSADPQANPQSASSSAVKQAPASGDMVRRQGRDWALPGSVAQSRGNAIVRSIRVQCYHDRFVLLPPRQGSLRVFDFPNGEVARATIELATAVRDRIESWGPAIPGGRWQPRLEVEVMSHGEARFHQLRTLMSGSGVEVKGRTQR